jgi:hypothetical protein
VRTNKRAYAEAVRGQIIKGTKCHAKESGCYPEEAHRDGKAGR